MEAVTLFLPVANFPEPDAGFAPAEQIQLPGASLLLMNILIHPHAKERMEERGATEAEVRATIAEGEKFPAKFGRAGFRRNFTFERSRDGKFFRIKQVVVYGIQERKDFIVITVVVRYF